MELAVFSLMWSEHCGYKHSKPLLRRFPTKGEHVLQGPGENAGIVDIGGGVAVAMKIESHNHPSAVEPYQGAATGVGGIIRDIFAMGARPICGLDSLRFGEIQPLPAPGRLGRRGGGGGGRRVARHGPQRSGAQPPALPVRARGRRGRRLRQLHGHPHGGRRDLLRGPLRRQLPGERHDRGAGAGRTRSSAAARRGWATTWCSSDPRPAATASAGPACWPARCSTRRWSRSGPSVQVGDPFTEKKLLEACLELLRADLLVALQDLGAAGITSSSSEMAAKGEVGIDLHADRVPLREADMEPWEIMISESQERMLAIVAPEQWEGVRAVCDRWDLDATIVGEVTDTKHLRVFFGGEMVGDMDAMALAEPPCYAIPQERPAHEVDEPLDPAEYPRPGGVARGHPPRPHRLAEHRQPALGVQAVRPSGAAQHGDRPRRRRGAAAHQEDGRRHRGLHRRQRPPDLPRPLSGRQGGGGRGGAQRLLRGREAHRHHQLPQLRQPRQRAHRLSTGSGDRGDGRGLRGVRARR